MKIYDILTDMGYDISNKKSHIEGEEGTFFSAENDGENYCIHMYNDNEFSVTGSKWMVIPDNLDLDVESSYEDEEGILMDYDTEFFIYDTNTGEEARLDLPSFLQVMEINCVK